MVETPSFEDDHCMPTAIHACFPPAQKPFVMSTGSEATTLTIVAKIITDLTRYRPIVLELI